MKIYKFLGKNGRTTIPYAMRVKLGICDNEFVSFEDMQDGTIIVRRENMCECPSGCLFADDDTITIYDILNSLNEQEKKAAIVHLTMSLTENG